MKTRPLCFVDHAGRAVDLFLLEFGYHHIFHVNEVLFSKFNLRHILEGINPAGRDTGNPII